MQIFRKAVILADVQNLNENLETYILKQDF